MKVKILKNVEKCNGQKVVKFSSDIGCAEVHWNGEEPVEVEIILWRLKYRI
ncbi:hypothetical protein [Cytobacillus horneckiae]|uniref:hypothetical protein n=1 Tax=Cytobacillus horneckiae TaxID=549687 RepID=UPI003D9A7E26